MSIGYIKIPQHTNNLLISSTLHILMKRIREFVSPTKTTGHKRYNSQATPTKGRKSDTNTAGSSRTTFSKKNPPPISGSRTQTSSAGPSSREQQKQDAMDSATFTQYFVDAMKNEAVMF